MKRNAKFVYLCCGFFTLLVLHWLLRNGWLVEKSATKNSFLEKLFPGTNTENSKKFPSFEDIKFDKYNSGNFDTNGDGYVDFREFLCSLSVSYGNKLQRKLEWAFTVYDIDKDGYIVGQEMLDVVSPIYNMMRGDINMLDDDYTPREGIEKVISQLDKNGDRKISMEEFVEGRPKIDIFIHQVLMCEKLKNIRLVYEFSHGIVTVLPNNNYLTMSS